MISPLVTTFSSFSVATIPSPAVTIRICSLSWAWNLFRTPFPKFIMFTLNSLLSGTNSCLVTSGPVKIGLGKGSPARLKADVGTESINLAFDDRDTANRAMTDLGDLAERIQADRDTVRLYVSQAVNMVPVVPQLHRTDWRIRL